MLDFMPRRRTVLCVLLILLTVAVYGRACRFGFVGIDDGRYVSKNAHVLGGLHAGSVRWAWTTLFDGNWFPLTWLSLMADASLYGPYPGGFHLTNIVLHIINVLLVFDLFVAMTGNQLRSGLVAALFAVHPLHVESVAFISERKDVLSIFFGLLALSAYVRFARGRGLVWWVASFCVFVCSLLAKQTLVTLPCLLLLLDFWPLARLTEESMRRRLLEKIPFAMVAAAFCVIAYRAQASGGAIQSLRAMSLPQRLLNAVLSYGLYLSKIVVPWKLAFFYPHPPTLTLFDVALPALVLLGVTAVAVVEVRRLPFLFVGWCWFLGTLVPLIGLVQIGRQQMADRYAYFPAIGLYVAAAWSVPVLLDRIGLRRVRPLFATAVVGLYAALGFVQVGYWRDNNTLFRHALAVVAENSMTRGFYGTALIEEGRVAEGLQQCRQAVILAPNDSLARRQLANALLAAGDEREALKEYSVALGLDERSPGPHCQLAAVLSRLGRFPEAETHFRRAVELDPACTPAYLGLAEICRAKKDYAGAVMWNEKALQYDPTLFVARAGIARALWAEGRTDEAIARLQSGRALFPLEDQAYAELIAALTAAERPR
jgi:protein O-mannosyl-transferase